MQRSSVFQILIVSCLFLAACAAGGNGPQAWIDQPLDNNTLPNAPLTIQAHASDEDGVASFDFSIDGQLVQTVSAAGTRLGDASIEWTPPGPGTYSIGVQATNANGQAGSVALKTIVIDGAVVAAVVPLEEATATATSLATATTEAEEPADESDVTITANQNSNCREGTSSVFEVLGFLLGDETARVEGRDALSEWLVITAPDTEKLCWIAASLGQIEGDLNTVPIIATPIAPLPTATVAGAPPDPGQPTPDSSDPPPSGPDTTPPVIQSVNVSPASILTPGGGCSSAPRTTTVTVVATDPGGIAHATVFWNIAGDSGQAVLAFVGGDTWQGEAGPVSKTGTLNLFANVEDNAGNDVLSSVFTVQVQSCIN